MSKAARPKGVRACLVSGFKHPVDGRHASVFGVCRRLSCSRQFVEPGMDNAHGNPVERALILMRQAAELLDSSPVAEAPEHLRLAIETAEKMCSPEALPDRDRRST